MMLRSVFLALFIYVSFEPVVSIPLNNVAQSTKTEDCEENNCAGNNIYLTKIVKFL